MEALAILSAVQTAASATAQVAAYLKDVKGAGKQRAQMRAEAQSLVSLFADLKEELEDATDAKEGASSLERCSELLRGPLGVFQSEMEDFASKMRLEPGGEVGKRLRWPSDKKAVAEVLGRIERTKVLILLAMDRNQSGMLRELQRVIQNIEDDVGTIKSHQMDEKHEKALEWLSSANYASRKNDISATLEPGTRDWFIKSEKFKSWMEACNQTMLCIGGAAVGKTHLFSVVVNHLQETVATAPVLYFYCSNNDKQTQSPDVIIPSLLRQLASYSKDVLEVIFKMHAEHRSHNTRPSLCQLSSALIAALKSFEQVYVLIDALDEIVDAGGLRDTVIEQLHMLEQHSNLLATMRPIESIKNAWSDPVIVNIEAHDEDLRKCIDLQLDIERSLSRNIGQDKEFRELVTRTIIEKCRGLFLLAPLYLKSLAYKINKSQMRQALTTMPLGLDNMYMETLKRISDQGEEAAQLAARTLQFVTFAMRPLSLKELQMAVAIEADMTAVDEECLSDTETILSVCGGLLVVDSETHTVRLVHYTAQDFLKMYRGQTWDKAHDYIAKSCMAYISFKKPEEGLKWIRPSHGARMFLFYAMKYWGSHAKLVEANVLQDIRSFLSKDPRLRVMVRFINKTWSLFDKRSQDPLYTSERQLFALTVASHFGLIQTLQSLLATGPEVENVELWGLNPLSMAIRAGQEECILILFQSGFDIDYTDALHFAAENLDIIQFDKILSSGPNVNTRNIRDQTPLHYATRGEIAEALIRRGADIMARDERGSTPLHSAAGFGRADVVDILLKNGAEINAVDLVYLTPLLRACQSKQWNTAGQLLRSGAIVAIKEQLGASSTTSMLKTFRTDESVLRAILKQPNELLAQLLSERRITPLHRDNTGGTLLHWLPESLKMKKSSAGADVLISQIKQAGFDINAVDEKGNTALHVACQQGLRIPDTSKLRRCLRTSGRKTFMHCFDKTSVETIKILVRHGADVLLRNSDGSTPLESAISMWKLNTAKAMSDAISDREIDIEGKAIEIKLQVTETTRNDRILEILGLETL